MYFCDSTDLKRKKTLIQARFGGMKKDEDQENQDDDLESNIQYMSY